ncbi:MAG: cation:proton antiporter, partial [Candidatus Dormibacteraeota bacterium]|nr:cation:proton antiporter [Candidatus Dormibacteraeota bacterium]
MHALFLELGAIIFGLGLLGRLAGLIGMSPIPLYLLAGLAFGHGGALPLSTSHQFLEVGSEIGVVLLLLLLGLEYSAGELVANLRAQAPAGALNIVLNAAPGVAVALLLRWPLPAVLAMGGVTYCASSGITAKLLQDFGRIGNRETPIVLALLVLEDLSMAFYLPILTALVAGLGLLKGAEAEAIAIVAMAVVLVIALRFSPWVNRLVFSEDNEVLLLRVFGLALIVAGAAGLLQVSDAVGAFLIGIALSGRVAEGARQVLAPVRDLFAALFFVLFGLNTDPRAIPPVLGVAVILGAVTMGTKITTGWVAAQRGGVGLIGRVRAGTVIANCGEFNIVIATLAASSTRELGPLAATYVLLMAVAGPLVARIGEP